MFRWQPAFIDPYLDSYAGGREMFDNRRCSGYRALLLTAGSPRANSKYRLNSEAGALYPQVPRNKLRFCFKSLRKQSICLHLCIFV